MTAIDLNSDMGESFGVYTLGHDADMLKIVSSANVACGFHAGDPLVMAETIAIAKSCGVDVGAHPSFFDVWGFGRRPILGEKPEDIEKQVAYQIGAMLAMARHGGTRVTHVKTHGSLGNMAAVDLGLALGVARAIKAVDDRLLFVVMPGSQLEVAGAQLGLRMAREVFADRTYDDAGMLTSRKIEGAVIHDADLAANRVLAMVRDQALTSTSGKKIPVAIDTICVHGDNPAAVAMARAVRHALEQAGVTIRPMATTLAQ